MHIAHVHYIHVHVNSYFLNANSNVITTIKIAIKAKKSGKQILNTGHPASLFQSRCG